MDEEQNDLDNQVSDDDDVVNGGVGVGDAEEFGEADTTTEGIAGRDDPSSVKKRLGMQAKKHAREMRQIQDELMHMRSQLAPNNTHYPEHQSNPYSSPGQPNPPGMNEEERIQKAVRYALGAKDAEERQAQMAERQAHVHKQYKRLNDEFDRASEKYDDFDDIVRESDAPFSEHVRDALLLIQNPADVAYKLGKNRSELERISKLHPLDQAREINKLSFSLMGGNTGKANNQSKVNPLDTIRQNPAHSSTAITDKTPASVIRARMKAGTFK